MLGGAYFQIDRNGGYGKRNISFRAFPYPPFNVCFSYFSCSYFLLILLKSFYRVFHDVSKTRSLFARDPIYSAIEFLSRVSIYSVTEFLSRVSIYSVTEFLAFDENQ